MMKVRWKEHEMIFVTILTVVQIIFSLLKFYDPAFRQPGFGPAARFIENGLSFIYWRNVLLPEIGLIFLIYSGYVLINFVIIPSIKNITFDDVERLFTLTLLKP